MELLQLHYFRTVAKLEHMTKAAQELRIAQPALSKTIARLEDDLGVPLFDRQGRHIRLNAFGKAFLKKAEAALSLLEEGRQELADLAGLDNGTISLVTSTLNRLSEPIGAFHALHPGVHFRISHASMERMEQLIEQGDIDFGFTAIPIERTGIRDTPLLDEEVFLAVPPGHRFAQRSTICLSDVAGDPFIGYKEGYPFRSMNDEFCRKAGFKPNIVCEVDEPAGIGRLVRAGLGVALVGACRSDGETPLRLLRIVDPACRRTFRLAWHESRYMSAAARRFRDYLARYFEEMKRADVPAFSGEV
ncbi:LysR family transcriptional regulator [Paenibacillus flagellatus]|uniref:LysR family transcriptional regulator n=1 Tax=Paenibacillus flagellatus TaxID=2211139 RepID=A0A2V5K8C6_9BACL|nr:LysR family transcriptional regulator [Paenibacillus flagellatus]PYI54254.1 LysR family transcriptional regulator [Paenibacillus flagellatus]